MKIARGIDNQGNVVHVYPVDSNFCIVEGNIFSGEYTLTSRTADIRRWLSPVEPRAIICIGLNYKQHAIESGLEIPSEPVVFFKNPASVIGHEQAVVIPDVCEDEVDYECELAVIIARHCKNVSEDNALGYILGYTIANDVSARIWQTRRGGTQWSRAKSFDTFCPMGSVMVTADEIPNPNELALKTEINGEVVQNSNTGDMIFSVAKLISFLSQDTTLLPGTVILTGTPEGIGWAREPHLLLHGGDSIRMTIERIGTLANPVKIFQ